MTVSSATNKVSYSGDGSQTVFAYGFKIFDQDDLTVIIRNASGGETTQTITTNYTVSGVGNASGGNVTMVSAPASTETITIIREQPLTQGLDLVPNDPFPAALLEDTLDKFAFMVQKHEEVLSRTIKGSKTTTITNPSFTEDATARANKVFAFDASGNIDITQEIGVFKGNWAAGTTYAVRDLVKDTSTNNIFIAVTAHTSSGSQPLTTNTDSAKWALIVDAASAASSATAAASSASASASSASASLATSQQSASSASVSLAQANTSTTKAAESAASAAAALASQNAAATSESNAAASAASAAAAGEDAATALAIALGG